MNIDVCGSSALNSTAPHDVKTIESACYGSLRLYLGSDQSTAPISGLDPRAMTEYN
jgi:hypothetical protein